MYVITLFGFCIVHTEHGVTKIIKQQTNTCTLFINGCKKCSLTKPHVSVHHGANIRGHTEDKAPGVKH
jgi:hypothetical protein